MKGCIRRGKTYIRPSTEFGLRPHGSAGPRHLATDRPGLHPGSMPGKDPEGSGGSGHLEQPKRSNRARSRPTKAEAGLNIPTHLKVAIPNSFLVATALNSQPAERPRLVGLQAQESRYAEDREQVLLQPGGWRGRPGLWNLQVAHPSPYQRRIRPSHQTAGKRAFNVPTQLASRPMITRRGGRAATRAGSIRRAQASAVRPKRSA